MLGCGHVNGWQREMGAAARTGMSLLQKCQIVEAEPSRANGNVQP